MSWLSEGVEWLTGGGEPQWRGPAHYGYTPAPVVGVAPTPPGAAPGAPADAGADGFWEGFFKGLGEVALDAGKDWLGRKIDPQTGRPGPATTAGGPAGSALWVPLAILVLAVVLVVVLARRA